MSTNGRLVSFEAPLANLLTDFYDQLKSLTSGYGCFNYELDDYRAEDLVRLDFYVAGEMVDALERHGPPQRSPDVWAAKPSQN